jgi:hypothetical protein
MGDKISLLNSETKLESIKKLAPVLAIAGSIWL